MNLHYQDVIMGVVIQFFTKEQRAARKRMLWVESYLKQYCLDHEVVGMARMLGMPAVFQYYRNGEKVMIEKDDLPVVLKELERRGLKV
jgi:hypothetical protein